MFVIPEFRNASSGEISVVVAILLVVGAVTVPVQNANASTATYDFEDGSCDPWSGTATTTDPFEGSYSCEINSNSINDGIDYNSSVLAVKWTDFGSGSTDGEIEFATSVDRADIGPTSTGDLLDTVSGNDTGIDVQTGVWYEIEVTGIDNNDGTGALRVIQDDKIIGETTIETKDELNGPFLNFRVDQSTVVTDLIRLDRTTTAGSNVSGQIKDTSGVGLENVNVSLSTVGTTTTNSSGYYSFSEVADGNYTVTASDPWFVNESKDITVSGSNKTVNFTLNRKYSVTGTVTNDENNAVGNAEVSLQNGTGSNTVEYSTTTNASGIYTIKVPEDEYLLFADATGYFTTLKDIGVVDSNRTIDAVIEKRDPPYATAVAPKSDNYRRNRNVTLSATVVSSAEATIRAKVYWDNGNQFELVKNTTVASGDTVFADVNALRGQNRWYMNLSDTLGSRETRTYAFSTPANITVLYRENFSGVETANVTIASVSGTYRDDRKVIDGTLDLEGVPNQDLLINIEKTGYVNATFAIEDPTKFSYTLLAPKPGSGEPGANETVLQNFTLVDRDGRFPPEESRLIVERYYQGAWRTVDSEYFGASNFVTIPMVDGQTYRFTVRNSDGGVVSLGTKVYDQSSFDNPEDLIVRDQGDLDEAGENDPPIPRFTYSPQGPTTNDTIHFDGSASSDPDGDVVSWEWDLNGDGTYETSGRRITKQYVSGGLYDVRLRVEDDDGDRAVLERSVYVASTNRPPVPKIELSREDPVVNENVTFDGAISTDPNGNIQSYSWSVNGTTSTGTNVTESFSSSGNYTVELEVCDPGYCRTTERTFYVGANSTDANQPPIPRIEFSPSNPNATEQIQFNASNSSDPDGAIAHWRWDFNNDGDFEIDSETATWTYSTDGNYSVRLETEDGLGTTNSTTVNVTVGSGEPTDPANQPPVGRINFTPSDPLPGERIIFNASNSSDPEGNVTAYRWDFDNDGKYERQTAETQWTFQDAGRYVVSLEVEDGKGQTNTTTKVIAVGNVDSEADYEWDAFFTDPISGDNKTAIRFEWYVVGDANASDLHVKIYEDGKPNRPIVNRTYASPSTVVLTESLAGEQQEKTWVVEWSATVEGKQQSGQVVLNPGQSNPIPGLPPWTQAVIGTVVIWMTAGLFSQGNAALGGIVVSIEGSLFWLIGWLGTGATGGVVLVAFAISFYFRHGGDSL